MWHFKSVCHAGFKEQISLFPKYSFFFSFFQAGLEELQDQKVAVTREKERVDHENKKLVSSR